MIQDAETLGLLLDSIRRFVRERLIPAEVEVTEADAMPEAIVREMREMGLFGYALPREYGGLGLTTEEQMHVSFELCYASPVFRSYVGTNNGIGGMGIVIDGTPAQKERYLRRLAAGEIIGSFALTEPDNGSDAGGLKTFARRDGDHYVINGTKRYITNAPEASIVERDTPGLTTAPPDRKMGQRGSHTSDVILQDVRVPASALIGGVEGQGFKTAMKVLDRARLNIAAVCVGIAQRMLDETLAYAMQREQFGQPIAGFQLVQAMLADSKTEIYAARCMTLDAARLADEGANIATEASCAKLFASEMCSRVADRCVQVHGGAGYMQEYPIERLYRDVRLFRIFEGTSQIQQLVIAKNMIRDARG